MAIEPLAAADEDADRIHIGLSLAVALCPCLLEQVEDHKPVEIAPRSVIEVERVLGTVRESYPARRLPPSFTTVTCLGRSGRARALSSIGMESWLGASLSYF